MTNWYITYTDLGNVPDLQEVHFVRQVTWEVNQFCSFINMFISEMRELFIELQAIRHNYVTTIWGMVNVPVNSHCSLQCSRLKSFPKYTVGKIKNFSPGNLFFGSTVETFQIPEYRKVEIIPQGPVTLLCWFCLSSFLNFLRIWLNFCNISGRKLSIFEHCKTCK